MLWAGVNRGGQRRRFEQAQLSGAEDGPLLVVDPQLAIQLLDVPLHRTYRQGQLLSDFRSGVALGQQGQDLAFAAGEGFDERLASFAFPPV